MQSTMFRLSGLLVAASLAARVVAQSPAECRDTALAVTADLSTDSSLDMQVFSLDSLTLQRGLFIKHLSWRRTTETD